MLVQCTLVAEWALIRYVNKSICWITHLFSLFSVTACYHFADHHGRGILLLSREIILAPTSKRDHNPSHWNTCTSRVLDTSSVRYACCVDTLDMPCYYLIISVQRNTSLMLTLIYITFQFTYASALMCLL